MNKTRIKFYIALLFSLFALHAMAFIQFPKVFSHHQIAKNVALCAKPDIDLIAQQTKDLDPKILQLAIKAYQHACIKGIDYRGIITIIDYTKPSTAHRLWVIDLHRNRVLFNTLVAHGRDSTFLYPTYFSNNFGTHASSIGLYITGATYLGTHGYSLRLIGLEHGFNDNAYQRAVVMHQAWYVSEEFAKKYGRLGRSWGCPALSSKDFKPVIDVVKKGTLLFIYYPDKKWLSESTFLQEY